MWEGGVGEVYITKDKGERGKEGEGKRERGRWGRERKVRGSRREGRELWC